MKKRIQTVFLFFLLMTVGGLVYFNNTGGILSKVMLTDVLSETVDQMIGRFQRSPFMLLSLLQVQEGDGYTVDIGLFTEQEEPRYQIAAQIDTVNHLFYGNITSSDALCSMDLYADRSIFAFRDASAERRHFWGIRYDSLVKDLAQIPFVGELVSQTDLQLWQSYLSKIQKITNAQFIIPQWIFPSSKDIEAMLLGILAMPCTVENRTITQRAVQYNCIAFSYPISEALLQKAVSLGFLDKQTKDAEITFYLSQKSLVKTVIYIEKTDIIEEISIELGNDTEKDPLRIIFTSTKDTDRSEIFIQAETYSANGIPMQKWTITGCAEGGQKEYMLHCSWSTAEEVWVIQYRFRDNTIEMKLKENNGKLQIRTKDLPAIVKIILGESFCTQNPVCVMNIRPGAVITKPEWETPEKWNLNDIWEILSFLTDWLWGT